MPGSLSSPLIKVTVIIALLALGFVITKAFVISHTAPESAIINDIIMDPGKSPTLDVPVSGIDPSSWASEPQKDPLSEPHNHSDTLPSHPILSKKINNSSDYAQSSPLPPHLLVAEETNYPLNHNEVDPMSEDYLNELIESLRLAGMREDAIESLVQATETQSIDTDLTGILIDSSATNLEYQANEFMDTMRQSGMPEDQIQNMVDDIVCGRCGKFEAIK